MKKTLTALAVLCLLGLASTCLWPPAGELVAGVLRASVATTAPTLTVADLRAGDVILTKGRTGASHAVMAISQNPDAWTHSGLVSARRGQGPLLVHATPAFVHEQGQGIERVAVDELLEQPLVRKAGVFRPVDGAAGELAGAWADRLVGGGFVFDQDFDLDTSADLYCTELVYRAFTEGAGIELLAGGPPTLRWMLQSRVIVLPDHLAQSPRLTYLGDLK